jgi:hypothetical protein
MMVGGVARYIFVVFPYQLPAPEKYIIADRRRKGLGVNNAFVSTRQVVVK